MLAKRVRRFLLVTSAIALVLPGAATAASSKYPDLGMAPLSDIDAVTTGDGRHLLRFSATIVNVGSGAFEVDASRLNSTAVFEASQRLYDDGGGSSSISTPAVQLAFAGDGHSHWHVVNLESYELRRLDNGVKVGTSAKSGFCFYETTAYRLSLPGAPSSGAYDGSGCGTPESTTLRMGLSVGWGDMYPSYLPDQYIDITDLPNGKYRLYAEADASNWFAESNDSNNFTWTDIAISSRKNGSVRVRVIARGPAA